VRHGEELIVKDRNHPIARVLPFGPGENYDAEEEALVAAGLLRMPSAELPKNFWKTSVPSVPIEKSEQL